MRRRDHCLSFGPNQPALLRERPVFPNADREHAAVGSGAGLYQSAGPLAKDQPVAYGVEFIKDVIRLADEWSKPEVFLNRLDESAAVTPVVSTAGTLRKPAFGTGPQNLALRVLGFDSPGGAPGRGVE